MEEQTKKSEIFEIRDINTGDIILDNVEKLEIQASLTRALEIFYLRNDRKDRVALRLVMK